MKSSLLLLLLVAGLAVILVQGTMECDSYRYVYTLQPPEAIVCSPYILGILNLTCAVSGDLVDSIEWYFRPGEGTQTVVLTNNTQISNGSRITITPSEFAGDYSVILTLSDIDSENEGFYWCQGLIQHDDHTLELSRSDQFELLPSERYFPIACPRNKAHKSSAIRCAALLPKPVVTSTSLASSGLTSTVLPSSDQPVTPTISSPSHLPSTITALRSTTMQLFPTSKPTVIDNTAQPATPPPLDEGTVQLSDIILYAILGLLGCLVVLVFSLSIMISVLCCKKHRRTTGSKAVQHYDQFSAESGAPPGTLTLKSLDAYSMAPPPPPPYRLPLHPSHSDTLTLASSGVYDEITSQHGIQPCMLNMAAHHYQEIPVVPVGSVTDNDTLEADHLPDREVQDPALDEESDADTPQQPHFENLYDSSGQPASPARAPEMPAHQDSPDVLEFTVHSPQQSGCDSLKQSGVLEGDGHSSVCDFTSSNLQVTLPPPEEKVVTSCLTGSASSSSSDTVTAGLKVEPYVEFVVVDSSAEGSGTPVPDIPEHPYHVLEDNHDEERGATPRVHSITSQNGAHNNQELSNGTDPIQPPRVLHRLSFSEDEGYDRLVGPPHIYHILQKSPSLVRPHVRECSPTSGYHRLDVRMEPGVQSPQGRDHVYPLQDDVLHSGRSSVLSGSELFDDPQYNVSPKRAINGVPAEGSYPNSHNDHSTSTVMPNKVIDLSKYRGDYERDPTYMKLIQKQTVPSSEDSDHTNVQGSNKSSSLPDITHTYQSLQTLTRDPLRNYEMLQKCHVVTVDSTNV